MELEEGFGSTSEEVGGGKASSAPGGQNVLSFVSSLSPPHFVRQFWGREEWALLVRLLIRGTKPGV